MSFSQSDLIDLYQDISNKRIMFVYEGSFNQQVTKSLLDMIERNLDSIGETNAIKRKVFYVMLECLQNISKHASLTDDVLFGDSIFVIGRDEEKYFITSGNVIDKQQIEILKPQLEAINQLDAQGLKQLYKVTLRQTAINEKGGANLGLIDMARRSGNKLEYHFQKVDEVHAFFILKANVNTNL